MKKSTFLVLITAALLALAVHPASAEVISNVESSFKTTERPLDLATIADGSKTFVLTKKGNVLIYDAKGELTDTVSVGKAFDRMEASPAGDKLFLSSSKDKTVQVISLAYIKEINIADSPYKGAKDAPVIVAVFSDFQ